jgi:hypothetical protein
MARFMGFNIAKYLGIGVIGGIIAIVLAWFITILKIPAYIYNNGWFSFSASVVDVNLRDQLVNAGNYNIVGETFVKLLTFFNLNPISLVYIIIGSILTVFAGRIIVGFMTSTIPQFRVWLSYIIGSVVLSIFIISTTKIPFLTGVASMLVYGIVIGALVQWGVNQKSIKWISE